MGVVRSFLSYSFSCVVVMLVPVQQLVPVERVGIQRRGWSVYISTDCLLDTDSFTVSGLHIYEFLDCHLKLYYIEVVFMNILYYTIYIHTYNINYLFLRYLVVCNVWYYIVL